MGDERYMVFRKDARLWAIDTLVLSGVIDEPEIEEVPFVPSVIKGLLFFKNEAVPVLNITKSEEVCRSIIVIESIYGKVGIPVKEISGIYKREDILLKERKLEDEKEHILGKLGGEKIFYFDLKVINEFFKDIEIKN